MQTHTNSTIHAVISAILRIAASSLFVGNAVGKFIAGPTALVAYFDHLFHPTWLPLTLVRGTAYATPYLEGLLALWLIVGWRLRDAWISSALYMTILAFGMVVCQQYDTAAHNYLYVFVFCGGLYISADDRWHPRSNAPARVVVARH